ncbi:MAG: NAD-dependent epimerase/dehydratase family protein [Gordonia sp. (in: high G+C Gram-positive bacteria)]|uniref:NAD-dependent epimerase/dehydratase family protein n=1 Tax=Gordonia sp. (in: high G+C Gram-positive bacteria) TaxID=84139 RepID=UPI0039E40D49
MRVLITGGTGYVGGWTADAVLRAGHDVRFLVRSPDKLRRVADFFGWGEPDFVVGDFTDDAAVARALDGCDAVIHAAAEIALHGDAEADRVLLERGLTGARNVIGGAVAAGLDPIVHVSSCAVLWPPKSTELTDPAEPLPGGSGAYGAAKTAIEAYVRELQENGAPIAITYPGGVAGPSIDGYGGEGGDGLHTLVKLGVVGRTAGLTLVDSRDLADLHLRLLAPGQGPRRITATGSRITGADLARALSAAVGRWVPYLPIPNSVMTGVGKLADRFPSLVPASLHQLGEAAVGFLLHPPFPENAAAEALGATFRPAEKTIASVFAET